MPLARGSKPHGRRRSPVVPSGALRNNRTRSPLLQHRHRLLLALAFVAVSAPVTAAERPLRVDDLFPIKDVADPRLSPDGRFVAYTVADARRQEGRARTATSTWRRSTAASRCGSPPARRASRRRASARTASGSRSSRAARADMRAGLPAEPPRRRGREAHRLQGRACRTSPGRPTRSGWRSSSRTRTRTRRPTPTTTRGGRDREGQDREADRACAASSSSATARATCASSARTSTCSTSRRRRRSSSPPAPSTTRTRPGRPTAQRIAFVSNRTLPDPDLSQNTRHLRGRGAARARSRARVATGPSERREPRLEPRRAVDRLRRGRRPEGHLVRREPPGGRPAPAGGASRALTAALDRNVLVAALRARRPLAAVPARGRRQPAPGARAASRAAPSSASSPASATCRPSTSAADGAIVGARELAAAARRDLALSASGGLRARHARERRVPEGHPAGRGRALPGEEQDGTPVDGFLTLPPGLHGRRTKLPAILRIHGGPASQYSTAFDLEWQMLAAYGYAVDRREPARLDRLRHAPSAARSGPTGATRTSRT